MQRRITYSPGGISLGDGFACGGGARTDAVRGVQTRLRGPFRRVKKEADESRRPCSGCSVPAKGVRFSRA